MNRLCSIFLVLVLGVFLAGCGPIYKTEYAYTPPASTVGTMCVNQCVQAKTICKQMCDMRNENCRSRARQDALYEFEIYKRDRRAHGKSVDKSISDFDRSFFNCNQSCDCTSAYHSCYTSCGGQIYERKVCVAFCGK